MLHSKKIDRICCTALAAMLILTSLLWSVTGSVQGDGSHLVGYENRLFDQTFVHTIDIVMNESDWDEMIAQAQSEEYTDCNVIIDGEKYNHVAIRTKGNTSLSSVAAANSSRYSFKLEFDHYVEGMTYHGLDKLSLNNLIQDATAMKDYLAYTLMNRMGVPSPLCSYVQINVNGEFWGLYLAVEGVEDGFLDRNGMSQGELYKPDSMSFGGGRGNGADFDISQFRTDEGQGETETVVPDEFAASGGESEADEFAASGGESMPDEFAVSDGESEADEFAASGGEGMPDEFTASDGDSSADEFTASDGSSMPEGDIPTVPEGDFSFDFDMEEAEELFGGFNFGMGNDDVKLIYSDGDPDSYSNIFNNAKTDVNDTDKERLIESIRKLNEQEDIENTVDTEEVIRYLAVHNFLCNDDSYTGMMVHNYYLYEEEGQLSIIPWDYNLAFGGFSATVNATSTVNSTIDSPVSSGTTDSRPLIAWIFEDEEFLEQYHEIYDEFITENIENGWLVEEIERVKEMILPYLEQDTSAFYSMAEFEKGISTLAEFCELRARSVRGQLDGTIPSTTEGRRNDSSSLIDGSGLSTSDMGSMDTGSMGPGNMPMGNMPEFP